MLKYFDLNKSTNKSELKTTAKKIFLIYFTFITKKCCLTLDTL